MKIQITENESYEIKFKENVTPDEFQGILLRFQEIQKIINRTSSNIVLPTKEKKQYVKRESRSSAPFMVDRDEAIKVFKLNYLGTREEKEEYASKMGKKWNEITGRLTAAKQKWKITTQDVGIPVFDMKMVREWRLKNATKKE